MAYSIYRHLAIEGAQPPPSDSQLRAIEEELGAELPPSFREYLNAANGGYLEYVIDVPTGAGRVEGLSFCDLFSADVGTFGDNTFVGEIRSGREYAKIPKGVLPFARDGGGSIVYLDLTAQGNGCVIAFVEGLPDWAGNRAESAFIQIASSFEEYVSALRIDIEEVIDHLEHGVEKLAHIAAIEEWLDIGLPHWRSNVPLATAVQSARERLGTEV